MRKRLSYLAGVRGLKLERTRVEGGKGQSYLAGVRGLKHT